MNIRTRIYTVILLASLCSVTASAADWHKIPNSDSSFDTSRITRISPSILRVWEKYVLMDENLDYARKLGLSDEYRDYSYSIALRQIDCGQQTHGFISIHNFDSHGVPTSSTNFKDADIEMNRAVPDTKAEALIGAVCDYSKHKLSKK